MSDLTIDETVALLRAHAFTVPEPEDGDDWTSDVGRTLIHSRLGGIGADWDLDAAIALTQRSTWRGWLDSMLGHNLGIGVSDNGRERLYAFDVPAPKPDEIARLREIVEQLRALGVSDAALVPVEKWIAAKASE